MQQTDLPRWSVPKLQQLELNCGDDTHRESNSDHHFYMQMSQWTRTLWHRHRSWVYVYSASLNAFSYIQHYISILLFCLFDSKLKRSFIYLRLLIKVLVRKTFGLKSRRDPDVKVFVALVGLNILHFCFIYVICQKTPYPAPLTEVLWNPHQLIYPDAGLVGHRRLSV